MQTAPKMCPILSELAIRTLNKVMCLKEDCEWYSAEYDCCIAKDMTVSLDVIATNININYEKPENSFLEEATVPNLTDKDLEEMADEADETKVNQTEKEIELTSLA